MAIPAILYAAKSTEDLNGSIRTQLEDARELARHEGLDIVADFRDEAASAYKGDRGPGLSAALDRCEALAAEHGEAALIVQHSDRLARGDGRRAKHLVEYALWALKHDIKILSVQDSQTFSDLLYAVVTGQRNHEDSKRKGAATAAGHRRRWESGKRLGGKIRDGFKLIPVLDANGEPIVGKDGRAVRDVAPDPERAPVWRRIFDLIESGREPGEVRATLNAEGIYRKRGGPWGTRDIRRGVLDDFYAGRAHAYNGEAIEDDHEPLIEPARWERIAAMVRTDERASKGGRPPLAGGADYLLRRIASCGRCGSPLRTRTLAAGRMYICAAVRESRGTCDADYLPAEPLERAVIDHLDLFLDNAKQWIKDRAQEADKGRRQYGDALKAQRAEQRRLSLKIEKARDQWERLLGEDDDAADAGLRAVGRLEADADHLDEVVSSMEAKLAEWQTADVDAALDFYNDVRDTISGRVKAAQGLGDLRAALRSILARVAVKASADGTLMSAHFELVGSAVDEGRAPMIVSAGWSIEGDEIGTPLVAAYSADPDVGSGLRAFTREEPVTTS